MERATVNVATGAFGPVLQKLTALLVQEQYRSRLGAETRSDIEFLKSELASLHSLLLRIWEREDLGVRKEWMVHALELSYDMDDGIDDFMLGLKPSDGGDRFRSIFWKFKIRVENVVKSSQRLFGGWSAPDEAISSHRSKRIKDPQAGFLRDASELVGMDKPKEQLLKLLQDHEMVCIHGFAGMGKTTLADLVYHQIGHEFQCRAFVSLSKSPDMLEVLRALLSQVTDGVQSSGSRSTKAATQENLRNEISHFLSDKRYLVIVDDIWHWQEWEIIRRALPEGAPRHRILTTTRANAIAEKCRLTKFDNGSACIYQHGGIDDQDAVILSWRVLYGMFLGDSSRASEELLAKRIAEMCCGMPLAVKGLSSAVASSIVDEYLKWYEIILTVGFSFRHKVDALDRRLWNMLSDGLLSCSNTHPSLIQLVESLRLSYDDLPLHLKTCLMYCSMYPTGYLKIERHGLVRKWMAEGFLYHQHQAGEEAAAAGEGCFDELVSRGLFQPESSEGIKQYYSVHPMMRAFLVCKSEQANFAAYHDDNSRPSILDARRIRRMSVGFLGRPADIVSVMDGALRARSLVVSSYPWPHAGGCLVCWEQLENVRLLSIESTGFPLSDIDLADICSRLLRLRYLGLKATAISTLPTQIGKLQSLETLDISDTAVSELPKEIQELWCLETLDLSNTRVSELPREIGKLQRLETLNASNTSVRELPKEIGQLHHLKTLDVSHTRVRELPREIEKLQHMKTLNVTYTRVRELPWLLSKSVSVLAGNKYPAKVGKLSNNDFDVLRHLVEDTNFSSLEKPGEDLTIMLYDHSYKLLPVAGLKIVGRHVRVPEWVKQHLASVSTLDIRLCKLNQDDLSFLHNRMPNLQHLTLRLEVLPRKAIVITGAGFSRLMSFCLDCRLPMVIFEQGAMPKLEHLEFKFYASRALTSEDPVGIRHLLSLKRVVFQSSPRYKSDAPGISSVINMVREEAKDHPNKITISINGNDTTVFPEMKTTADIGGLMVMTIIERIGRVLREALMRAAAGQGKTEENQEIREAQE